MTQWTAPYDEGSEVNAHGAFYHILRSAVQKSNVDHATGEISLECNYEAVYPLLKHSGALADFYSIYNSLWFYDIGGYFSDIYAEIVFNGGAISSPSSITITGRILGIDAHKHPDYNSPVMATGKL